MFKLEEPEDHGMGIETHAGLGSADFSTNAQGVRDSEEARDQRQCRSIRRGSRTQNELANAKEAHSCRHSFYVTEARRVDGNSHLQVIQISVVGLKHTLD